MDPSGGITEEYMVIRKRDAYSIVKQMLSDDKKAKHLKDRLVDRYNDGNVNILEEEKLETFLIDFINNSDTFFSYFDIPRDHLSIPELPEYITKYLLHLKTIVKKRKESKYPKWPLVLFSKDVEEIVFPRNTSINTYFVNGKYTMIIKVKLKGNVSIHGFPILNRFFSFDSVTFLSFIDTQNIIKEAKDNQRIKMFNTIMEHFITSFSEQNDYYDYIIQ